MSPNRRTVLGCTAGVLTGLAGCTGSSSGGGRVNGYGNWLGPEMAKAQWVYYRETVDYVDGFAAVSPSTAANATRISDSTREFLTDRYAALPPIEPSERFSPSEIDLSVRDYYGLFEVMTGDFDRTELEETIDAERRATHERHSLYVTESGERYAENGETPYFRGFGIGDRSIPIAYAAPSEEEALEYVRSMIDTGADSAPRFVDSDGPTSEVAEILGDGVYVSGHLFGWEEPSGLRVRIDGETAHRRTALYGGSDVESYASSVRERVNRASNVTAEGRRMQIDMLAAYDSVTVETESDWVIVDGEIPTADLEPIDFDMGGGF